MDIIKAIGLMSGTSCDGLDVAACIFEEKQGSWNYNIIDAITIKYDNHIRELLNEATHCSGYKLLKIHNEYGNYLGEEVKKFINKTGFIPDLISSHGHTIFHKPGEGITFQIGNPYLIAKITNLMVVADFRVSDVILGGQGAPLVPIGDELLFSEYDACLNLGGFANISFKRKGNRIAFDICPVNYVLNFFSQKIGYEYDVDGNISKRGKTDLGLLEELNNLSYYKLKYPKSLGREWVEENIFKVINMHLYKLKVEDILNTLVEHISIQIANTINNFDLKTVLSTGGGVYNKYLIEKIKSKIKSELIIPDKKIVEYKEALIFAFMGVLRVKNQINCLASYTGAIKDHIAGNLYFV